MFLQSYSHVGKRSRTCPRGSCSGDIPIDFRLVDEPRCLSSAKSRTANGCIRKESMSVFPKQDDGTLCGDLAASVFNDKAQGLLFGRGKRPGNRRKELGSCSEVDPFRVDFRAWLLIEEGIPGQALDFRDDFRTRAPI